MDLTQIEGIMNLGSEAYTSTRYVSYLAHSVSISITWLFGTDYRIWRLESPILLEQQQQVLGIDNSAVETLDMLDTTAGNTWMKLNGMVWLTI